MKNLLGVVMISHALRNKRQIPVYKYKTRRSFSIQAREKSEKIREKKVHSKGTNSHIHSIKMNHSNPAGPAQQPQIPIRSNWPVWLTRWLEEAREVTSRFIDWLHDPKVLFIILSISAVLWVLMIILIHFLCTCKC